MKISSRLAILAVVLPVAAFADINGTLTMTANTYVSMDTGNPVGSGGDFFWNGSNLSLVPQGSAKALNVTALLGSSYSGSSGFALLTQAVLQAGLSAGLGSSSPLTGLAANTVVGYFTNGGNYGKLLVQNQTSSSITFQYTTYEAGGGSTPTITSIQNNYGLIVAGLPNYGIAPGALFIIKGTNLASIPISSVTVQNSGGSGIPLTLNQASITVVVNGTTVHPGLYYAGSTQLAAVLPSGTPVGTGTVTVTYNGATSAPATLTVVSSALGLDTYYGTGSGLGVATNPSTGALYTYTNSISPGATIVLWGSGLGADTADSDVVYSSSPHAVSPTPTIYIGGVKATVLYAGSAGYPGVNQLNVTVPASAPTGCGVSVVAVSGSIVSNTISLPINAGGGVCSDPLTGVTGSIINTLTGKTNYNSGTVFLLQSTSSGQTAAIADGSFQNVQTSGSSTISGITSIGSCSVTISGTVTGTVTSTSTGLNAGTITVTGPTGTQPLSAIPTVTGDYLVQLPSGFIPSSGGSFTFNGSGGSQVGAFSVSVNYTNPLVWTNSSSIPSVARASGQPITWTGGASGSYVLIIGSSSSAAASASFSCYAPASAGQFTVPSYVLLALPAGSGTLGLENITTPVSFTATGLDYGTAFAGTGVSISPTYQ